MAPNTDRTLGLGESEPTYGALESAASSDAAGPPKPALSRLLALVLAAGAVAVVALTASGYGGGADTAVRSAVDKTYTAMEEPDAQPSAFQSSHWSSDRMGLADEDGARWKVTYKKGNDESSWQVYHESDPEASWKNGYKWATNTQSVSADGWSPCQPACGKSYRVREVACIRSDGTVVDDAFCTGKDKPNAVETCMNYSDCVPCWDVGEWSDCGVVGDCCGECLKQRAVTCRFCEPVAVLPVDVPSPLMRIGFVEYDDDGRPALLDSSEAACRTGKVGICNEPADWSKINRVRPWKPPHDPDGETRYIETGYDCTLLGRPASEVDGNELWAEGALTTDDHPTYPNTEYVHIGPFDRQTLEPAQQDQCVNFCGCDYEFKYGGWPQGGDWEEDSGKCFANNWVDESADDIARAGCVLEQQGQISRLASPFDYQEMDQHAEQVTCGLGFERRWSRCCRAVLVGTCKTSGEPCVAAGPVAESDGDSHQASDFSTEVICPYVEKGRVESLLRDGNIPVIERDDCVDLQTMYECDESPTEGEWPTAEERPANSRLVDGILAFTHGDSCVGVVRNNDCSFPLQEDTCRACTDYSNCTCAWQCTPWCNHAMNMTIDSVGDIDMQCFEGGANEECPAECATTAYQNRQCWCRKLTVETMNCAESGGNCLSSQCCLDAGDTCWLRDDSYAQCAPACPDDSWDCSRVSFQDGSGMITHIAIPADALVTTNSSSPDFCCVDPIPDTLRPCENDEFCQVEPCVMHDFPVCGGEGWCGNFLLERDINCCRSDGVAMPSWHCGGDEDVDPDWELVMKIGRDSEFTFDSPYWENDAVLHELDEDAPNRKLSAFNTKKFNVIRMCFGYGFELENPDFEGDAMGAMTRDGAPKGWVLHGNGVTLVKSGNPSYNEMRAQSGTQFVSVHAQSGLIGSLKGLVPGQLTVVKFGAASRARDELATMQVRINDAVVITQPQVGFGSFFEYRVQFTPTQTAVTLVIENESDEGQLLVDDVSVTSDGWMLAAQELATDDAFNLRFLGRQFGADQLVDPLFGGASGSIAHRFVFGEDYDEVRVVYGDTYYQFFPSADVFSGRVDLNISLDQLTSNDGDLMAWVQDAGGAQFCQAASFVNDTQPGETSWGILPADNNQRGCGCTSAGFGGRGAYYAGTPSPNCTGSCECYTGGFTGSALDGAAKGWAVPEYEDAHRSGRSDLQIFVRDTIAHVGAMDESSQNCIEYRFDRLWRSAQDLFRAGEYKVETFDQAQFEAIFAEDTNGCAMGNPGFNVRAGTANAARWGYFNNKPSDGCETAKTADYDAAVGIGLLGESDSDGVGAGWTHLFVSDEPTDDSKMFKQAWLWVADTTQTSHVPGFATLSPYDWNADGAIVSDGFLNTATSVKECKLRCAEMDDCAVGVYLSGTTRHGECWLASRKANASNSDFCGADDTRQCVAFEKASKLLRRTCEAAVSAEGYLEVPTDDEWSINALFPTGEKLYLLVNGTEDLAPAAVAPTDLVRSGGELGAVNSSASSVWGPLTVSHLESKQYSYGKATRVYWTNPQGGAVPAVAADACAYTIRKTPEPMVRWPGAIVDCEHKDGVRYMSEQACREACNRDESCGGYSLWMSESKDNQENHLENGDFEIESFDAEFITYAAGEATVQFGWDVTKGDVDIMSSASETIQDIPSGDKVLDLNGDSTGAISQVINTRPGQTYLLSFYASGNGDCKPMHKSMNVFWSGCVGDDCAAAQAEVTDLFSDNMGNRVVGLTLFASGFTRSDLEWKHYIYEVTATEETSRLTFQSTTDGCGGFLLDDIKLVLSAPLGDECAALGKGLEVELVDERIVIDSFCRSDAYKYNRYFLDEAIMAHAEHSLTKSFAGFLELTDSDNECYDVVWGGVSERWGDLPDELRSCGELPNDAETTDATGPFFGARTWFKGVQSGGSAMTYTYKLIFSQRSVILNIKIVGSNFDGAEWKLTNDKMVVLSEREYNQVAPGPGDYSTVSASDYHSVDCEDCGTCTVILPGSPMAVEEVYYLSEYSRDALGKLRTQICVRTPTCYLHSEEAQYTQTAAGVQTEVAEPCTDGLIHHVSFADDTHAAVIKQDKCDRLSTRANRHYYGITKPLGEDRAVMFAVQSRGTVRVGLFQHQQPVLMSADADGGRVTDAPMYQIVLDDDSVSSIRRGMSSEEKDSATTVGFVGTDEVRWYWADARFIGGEFFVRAGKSNVPGVDIFLQWSDPEPLPVSHVAVSSWDSEGEWRVCSDRVFGTPHSRQVCVDLTDCRCVWQASVDDAAFEDQVECSEHCGHGSRSRTVSCLVEGCERNSALCTIDGKPCWPYVKTSNDNCVVKLYEQYAHGFGPSGHDVNYKDGWEITFGSHDHKDLPPDFKNDVKSVVIEGERCSVILFDGDGQTGSMQELNVPAGKDYHVWNMGDDFPSAFKDMTNSVMVAQTNRNFCGEEQKPATQIACYETRGCCYAFSRCDWEDCAVADDQCVTEWDDEPDGTQEREVKCEMRKFVCDEWRPAVNAQEHVAANADGEVCTKRRYVSSLEFARDSQCLEPLTDMQRELGCPPTPSVFLGSELLECNANKDFADVGMPVCDKDLLTDDAPVCDLESRDTDYAYSKSRQCGGSQVAHWMTCSWDAGIWSKCKGCGDVMQTRDAKCRRVDGEVVECTQNVLDTYGKCCYSPDFHTNCGGCDAASKPPTEQHCVDFGACQYEWHVKSTDDAAHTNCETFTQCVQYDSWKVDDRALGTSDDQKEWCTQGPERSGDDDAFVTYGLGACWQPDTDVTTLAGEGWTTPCPCYFGNAGPIDFGYHALGDRNVECKANHKYAQRFLLEQPAYVSSIVVDIQGVAQVKGAIYSDSGGRPSARLYATTEVHSRTGRSWVEMPFAQNDDGGVFLSGGFYWLSFQLKQDAQCYGASADAGGGSELYMSNEDGYGLGSPSDPFDPFQEVGTEDGTISIYANYESAGIETKKMEAGKCTAVETCEECLRATDSEDHSACVFVIVDEHFPAGSTSRSPCQSQQTVEAAGLSPDHTCQETWGLSLYTELADMECGGTPVAGPGGEMATDVANEEQCAENCHLANSHFLPYTAEGLHADPRESKYCEAYEYDANLRRCTLLSLIEPEAEAGGSCHVSAELGDVCALPIGVWVRSSLGKIYYVSGAQGQLRAAPQELTCFGEPVWGGQAEPELWCDGTADSACDVCINAPIAHSKLLGEMSCEDLQVKVARVCQFETADVECDKGEVIRLLEGSYGRFTDAYCVSPTVESLTTGDVCGEVDNEHSAIANLCDGKSVCTIDATDERFSDQNCPGTYKYAQVRYSCVPSGPGRHTPRHATDHWGVDPLGGQ